MRLFFGGESLLLHAAAANLAELDAFAAVAVAVLAGPVVLRLLRGGGVRKDGKGEGGG